MNATGPREHPPLEPLHLHPIHAHVLPRITIFVEDLQRAARTFFGGLDLRFQGFSFTSEILFERLSDTSCMSFLLLLYDQFFLRGRLEGRLGRYSGTSSSASTGLLGEALRGTTVRRVDAIDA